LRFYQEERHQINFPTSPVFSQDQYSSRARREEVRDATLSVTYWHDDNNSMKIDNQNFSISILKYIKAEAQTIDPGFVEGSPRRSRTFDFDPGPR
jgi:hypothetical protein